jgi:hypothetical protein
MTSIALERSVCRHRIPYRASYTLTMARRVLASTLAMATAPAAPGVNIRANLQSGSYAMPIASRSRPDPRFLFPAVSLVIGIVGFATLATGLCAVAPPAVIVPRPTISRLGEGMATGHADADACACDRGRDSMRVPAHREMRDRHAADMLRHRTREEDNDSADARTNGLTARDGRRLAAAHLAEPA